jgi:hypothetical protein
LPIVTSMIKAGTVDRLSLGYEAVPECARRAQLLYRRFQV